MRCFAALLALASVASAQAILEHAVAASVGSVAGVAGKKVNEGLDKVLATVNKAAAATPEPPAQQSQAAGQRIAAPEPGANATM